MRARTFGQCIDAVRALDVAWDDGPVAGEDDASVLASLKAAEVPFPDLPATPLAETFEADFTFYFRSNSPMDTNSAVADVRADRATVWAGLKVPIVAQQRIAEALGMTQEQVQVNVVQGGGSFGRRLFNDGALEAAKISQAMGKPVKLMWHRADDARVGRTHPMATSRIRAAYAGGQVLAFQQLHTSIETDFRHGLGEMLSARAADLPAGLGNMGYAQSIFAMTQELPYDFGAVTQTLVETDDRFNTGSMRNIYSPDVRTASELAVDQLAAAMGKDPYRFRQEFSRNDRVLAVLDEVARVGRWGRTMPRGHRAGDRGPQGVQGRQRLPGGDRLPPRDGRAQHPARRHRPAGHPGRLRDRRRPRGQPARAGGADAGRHQRRDRAGPHLEPAPGRRALRRGELGQLLLHAAVEHAARRAGRRDAVGLGQPGGAGEAGVAASMAATACAFARATRTLPEYFPVNHRDPLAFTVKPFSPPIPQSPRNGLRRTY